MDATVIERARKAIKQSHQVLLDNPALDTNGLGPP